MAHHYVDDEIASQPDSWRQAADRAADSAGSLISAGERIAFVGCGTSWFVAQVVASLREARRLGESDAFTASELPDRPYDRVVAFTRSGTTSEVVQVLDRLKGRVPTVVVVGDLDTPAPSLADEVVDFSFADEKSVVQTRFATSIMALARTAFGEDVTAAAREAEAVLAEPLPTGLVEAEQITFLGQGWTVGLAHEAALKLRETSAGWAESYPAMDYRHGPVSIAQPGRVVWSLGAAPAGLGDEVRATGADFVASERDPMAELVLAQRVAVARAVTAGLNPDQPRNLNRSVVLQDAS